MQQTLSKKRPASQASIDAMFNGSVKRAKIEPSSNGNTTKDARDGPLIGSPEKLTSVIAVKTDQ